MKWVIEAFDAESSFGLLADEAKRQGHEVVLVDDRFEEMHRKAVNEKLFGSWREHECVLFQGSIQQAIKLQRDMAWVPGVIANWHNYKCQTYYTHWGKYLYNQDYQMMPFAEMMRRRNDLHRFFARPNDGMKSFSGMVIDNNLSKNMERYLLSETSPDELVVVAPVQEPYKEWRLICAGDEIVTGCQYRNSGKTEYSTEVPDEVMTYAASILRESSWRPDPIFVMDITCPALSYQRLELIRLLEIGAFSVASLYACDLEKIVKVASAYAESAHSR